MFPGGFQGPICQEIMGFQMTGKKGSIQEANRGDRNGSLRHQMEAGIKRKARKRAEKIMGKNYFANMMTLKLTERKKNV